MRNPFVAVDAATDLRAQVRLLCRSWEQAMGGDDVPGVRPVIERSWRRLATAGIATDRLRPREAFDPGTIDDVRAASPLSGVIDILRSCLLRFADDSEHVMVVVDTGGRVLWVEGANAVRHRAERITFRVGMNWSEESAGTNAIGTALAIDHAVQVFSAEHFLREQHPWWCSAAPIHDAVSGELLGVVDLSGPLRTAHPDSLALVVAAAEMAERSIALRAAARDEALRMAFLESGAGRAGHRRALVAGDGRVLLALPAAWLPERIAPPHAGRAVAPGGSPLEAEPFARGAWVVTQSATRSGAAPTAAHRLALRLLGGGPHRVAVDGAPPLAVSARHAEILALLALHPEGRSCQALTDELHGSAGNPITTRAEIARLRRIIGPALGARPYRLLGRVHADFHEVERALATGDVGTALAAYPGPLLPDSTVPAIVAARRELEGVLGRVLGANPERLWAWLSAPAGRSDLDAMAAFVRAAAADDPRRQAIAGRLRALQPSCNPARATLPGAV